MCEVCLEAVGGPAPLTDQMRSVLRTLRYWDEYWSERYNKGTAGGDPFHVHIGNLNLDDGHLASCRPGTAWFWEQVATGYEPALWFLADALVDGLEALTEQERVTVCMMPYATWVDG
jgi:hypothetical protein